MSAVGDPPDPKIRRVKLINSVADLGAWSALPHTSVFSLLASMKTAAYGNLFTPKLGTSQSTQKCIGTIGVGAQSTLGGKTFLPENIYMKN